MVLMSIWYRLCQLWHLLIAKTLRFCGGAPVTAICCGISLRVHESINFMDFFVYNLTSCCNSEEVQRAVR